LWRQKCFITKRKKCHQVTHNQLTLCLNVFPHAAPHHSHFLRDTVRSECCYQALHCLGTSPHYKFYAVQFVYFISFLYIVVYLFIYLHKYNKSLLEILLVKYQHLIQVQVWRLQIRTQNNG
jgi:hypothetical protein